MGYSKKIFISGFLLCLCLTACGLNEVQNRVRGEARNEVQNEARNDVASDITEVIENLSGWEEALGSGSITAVFSLAE